MISLHVALIIYVTRCDTTPGDDAITICTKRTKKSTQSVESFIDPCDMS